MPTINKKLAEELIEKCKKQKKPKIYCVVRYQNRTKGDSEKGTYSDYAVCYKLEHYQAIMRSDFIGGVDVLWASKRFKADAQKQEQVELLSEALSFV